MGQSLSVLQKISGLASLRLGASASLWYPAHLKVSTAQELDRTKHSLNELPY